MQRYYFWVNEHRHVVKRIISRSNRKKKNQLKSVPCQSCSDENTPMQCGCRWWQGQCYCDRICLSGSPGTFQSICKRYLITFTWAKTRTHTHMRMYAKMHGHMSRCTCLRIDICVYACIYACIYECKSWHITTNLIAISKCPILSWASARLL